MSETEPNRYLWAIPTGEPFDQKAPGTLVAGRYNVINSSIWEDTTPEQVPFIPEFLPEISHPYMRLYPQRLHIPQVFGFCQLDPRGTNLVMLLDQIPFDLKEKNLYPSLKTKWKKATPIRKLYWLWQILNLWEPLNRQGVASSLLDPDNLRIQGWRIWLKELSTSSPNLIGLEQLGRVWQDLLEHGGLSEPLLTQLSELVKQMQTGDSVTVTTALNSILLQQAAQSPLSLEVGAATDTGPRYDHNEDTCYPLPDDLGDTGTTDSPLIPYLTLICDGIGGHEGGEIASQLAVQTVKQNILSFLNELPSQSHLLLPEQVIDRLKDCIKEANQLITTENDGQGRSARQRMGSTLVMGLQFPQNVGLTSPSHELYLAHVGDSRAYWMTHDYCQLLTVDDDVAGREVRLARALLQESSQRPDANALTQALGTRDSEYLRPTVQRFIIEEDGLLLLCSDGLSDNDCIERNWQEYIMPVLEGKISVLEAAKSLVDLANEYNGHDNVSVLLTRCSMTTQQLPSKEIYPLTHPLTTTALTTHVSPITGSSLTGENSIFFQSGDTLLLPKTRQSFVQFFKPLVWGLGVLGVVFLLFIFLINKPELKIHESNSSSPTTATPTVSPGNN